MPDGSSTLGLRRPMRSLEISASGLSAQRARMDVIASNIANAETTRTPEGGPYRRKSLELQELSFFPLLNGIVEVPEPRIGGVPAPWEERVGGVRVVGISEDGSEGALIYDPGHPDADEGGYVRMPNVNITDEMVDMMDARRLFEANASVFQAIKSMLRQAAGL